MKNHGLQIQVPGGEDKILLHACCAPCSGAIVEALLDRGIKPVIFYSNSNIYPEQEYRIRRDECIRFAASKGVEFVEDVYDHEQWRQGIAGLEDQPERGLRCVSCFRYRLRRAAEYAHTHGFHVLSTTLASSRWKVLSQVDSAGEAACAPFPDVTWWAQNWRKGGLQDRRNQIIKEMDFYNQLYCGCEFSMRKDKD